MSDIPKKKRKVMVVEDDISDHKMLCDFLLAQGFEVVPVTDAKMIFDKIQVTKPELIFIALMLNDFISGDEVVEKLHADPEFETRIVGMSSQVNPDSEYFYSLCDYQLVKPISIVTLNSILLKVFSEG